MSSSTLEIIRGLAQAAANVYDGVHDERYSLDGQARKVGLRREEGDLIIDKRVNDGFSVKFYGDRICIKYQCDVKLKDVKDPKFNQDIERMLNDIKKSRIAGTIAHDLNGMRDECFLPRTNGYTKSLKKEVKCQDLKSVK